MPGTPAPANVKDAQGWMPGKLPQLATFPNLAGATQPSEFLGIVDMEGGHAHQSIQCPHHRGFNDAKSAIMSAHLMGGSVVTEPGGSVVTEPAVASSNPSGESVMTEPPGPSSAK
eukprot:7139017-Karenia_brevis.AAC.1